MRYGLRYFAIIVMFLAAICAQNRNALAQQITLTDKARQSIVYIWFDVTNATTGARSTTQGTGFIVSKSGYVLTASHLFRDWGKQPDVYKEQNPIRGSLRDKAGFVVQSPLILRIINPGNAEFEDVALLKLPDAAQSFSAASVCVREASAARTGDNFVAYGFPQDQSFQPMEGTLGTTNAPGGRWAAAAPFTYGMSGGPVYTKRGFIVGLIKGGLPGLPAVNWISPIQHALDLLQKAGYVEDCGAEPVIDLCGSTVVTGPEKKLGYDGTPFSVYYNFTRGQEIIDARACGREFWITEDKANASFGVKFVYLVDGKKERTSQTLYIEDKDRTLRKAN